MISVKNLTKKIGELTILSNISFDIGTNETIIILGPSGSGKTTLLRCLCGLDEISNGEIIINNIVLSKENKSILNKSIGMVFQNFNLFPHMSVIENLIYNPIKTKMLSKNDAKDKALELLNKFSISKIIDKLPKDISGGQKQRVAITRALMMDPELLLMDEPTSALDPEIIKDFVEIVKILKQNLSLIITSHHIGFSKSIADKIIFMDRGLKLGEQNAVEFFAKPKSQRARLFLDSTII